MRKFKRGGVVLVGLFVGLSMGGIAKASTAWLSPPAVCQTGDGFTVTDYGTIHSTHSSGLNSLRCGMPNINPTTSTTDDLYVYLYDGNNNNLTDQDNWICYVQSCYPTLESGTCYYSGALYGNASGGTSSSGGTFSGNGYIRWLSLQRGSNYRTTLTCSVPNVDVGESYMKTIYYNWTSA